MHQRTIGGMLADKARRNGDKTFITFEDRRYSYAEVDRITNRVANGLAAIGVGHGAHVAILMNNRPEVLWLFFALGKLGAVAVPINTAAKGELLAYYIKQSDATLLVAEIDLIDRFLEVDERTPGISRAIVFNEAGGPPARLRHRSTVPIGDYRELEQGAETPPDAAVRFSDLAYLLYTSGTTGPSKGNLSTQAHALSAGFDIAAAYGYRADDVIYTCLPLFHANALLCSCMPALVADASLAISRRFSASAFWDEIRRYGATQFNALGAMTNFIWSRPPDPADADNPVRQCMVVPTPKEFYRDFERRFALTFTSLYALSDFCMVTLRGPDAPAEKWASAGPVRPEVAVRIVDDDDFDVATGTVGEIVMRTRVPWLAALGYYNMPEATVATNRNLWFHSGDRGYLDGDGYLYFTDRKKDAIRRRGENISSYEVEQIILRMDAVEDVAAFPVASELSEDEVMVSVVRRPGETLTAPALIEFCQANMAYYMVPRYVDFAADLPRTMSEKVQKYKLREAAEARLDEIWDREKAGIKLRR